MKVTFIVLFLLIISIVQTISIEDEDFNNNFTSQHKNLIHNKEQQHEFNGNLYENGNNEVSTRLNHKVMILESNNKLSVTIRKGGKGGGGGRSRGGGRGRFRAGGGAAAGVLGAGVVGDAAYNGHHHSNSSATSLSGGSHLYVSTFILCVSFWF